MPTAATPFRSRQFHFRNWSRLKSASASLKRTNVICGWRVRCLATRRNKSSSTGAVELSRAFRIWPGTPDLPEGNPLPNYLAASNQRFQQWILDTCLRPYDQTWLDYQQEIALRHTSLKKNQVDGVQSTPHVPLRDIIAFIPVMNETIKPYMAAKGHSPEDVEKMHLAWCKSLQLQISLWTGLYAKLTPNEW